MSFAVTLAQLAERFGAAITDQTEITHVYHNSADVSFLRYQAQSLMVRNMPKWQLRMGLLRS
jgi:hypothetical protein